MIKTEDIKKLNYRLCGTNEKRKKELDEMYGNTDRPKDDGRTLGHYPDAFIVDEYHPEISKTK